MVEGLEFLPRRLDFSSAGLGQHTTTAVMADGVQLVNALDLVDDGDPLQLIVCEHCGTIACQSGNWVSLRRLQAGLVFMPAFEEMARGSQERLECAPPYFTETKGIPWIQGSALTALAARTPFLADLARWPELTVREAALILQWESPRGFLTRFPDPPGLLPDTSAVVTHGENRATIAAATCFGSIAVCRGGGWEGAARARQLRL